MSSFKSNGNIHKKEDGSYYVVSANNVLLFMTLAQIVSQSVNRHSDFVLSAFLFSSYATFI